MSRFPTDIPDWLHVDLDGDEVRVVSRQLDREIQTAMVVTFRRRLITDGKAEADISLNAAFILWCNEGYAKAYRRHYIIEDTIK